MRYESTAASILGILLVLVFIVVFSAEFWESVVRPAVELAGATIYTFALPLAGIVVLLVGVRLFSRIRHL
ncbi:MAG: hypothetical protein D6679_10065 [Candidatus Hydrogenedentota bacterium]|nr:MAG: hypothetical protein D6679_10065 [Candidatus Hydrogenedentota bacterium]